MQVDSAVIQFEIQFLGNVSELCNCLKKEIFFFLSNLMVSSLNENIPRLKFKGIFPRLL